HAREINVRISTEIDLDRLAAAHAEYVEIDPRIGRAGLGIALRIGAGAVGPDRRAGDGGDRALVDPRDGNALVVRRPPMAAMPVHFLLRHELGDAPADLALAVAGQRPFLAR